MNVFEGGFFVTADDIYRWLTEGPGADSLNLAQDVTRHEMERENQRADQIMSLSNAVQAGWQGDAGRTAYSAVSPLAENALQGADQLRTSQDLLSRQSASFTDAANRVQPVPENPPENALDDAFPFDTDIDEETRHYQSAAQNNMAVFREYDGASSYNETNMPAEYNTTNRPMGNVTVTPPADTIEVGEPGQSGPVQGGPVQGDPRDGGPTDAAGPGNHSGYGAGPSGHPGGGGPAQGGYPGTVPTGGQHTTPNDYRPSPQPPYSYPPSYPPVTRPSPVPADPGNYSGGAPYGGHPGTGGGGFGRRGSGGAASGPGPGGRGFGAPPAPGPGVAAGALAAEEAAARRAAQAAAGTRPGGAGPMGAPMGGARNKDDEDTEHERKILLETDAEETFGSDELTAPQVIGDDEYED